MKVNALAWGLGDFQIKFHFLKSLKLVLLSVMTDVFFYRKSTKSDGLHKKKTVLQMEILESLFCAPKRSEDVPKRTRLPMGLNRTRAVGQKSVCAPLDDVEPTPSIKLTKEVDKGGRAL